MKFNFLKIVGLLTLLLLMGCSKGNDTLNNNENGIVPESYLMRQESSLVTNYLASYYNTSVSKIAYGNDIDTSDGIVTYVVTEIIVDNDSIARGYVATEKNSGDFLYFVDVDRDNYILTANDIVNLETFVAENIDEHDKYYGTNEFDFLDIIDDNNNNSPEGKFWGSGKKTCEEVYQATGTDGIHYCLKICKKPYYVFWVDVSGGSYPVGGLHEC